AAAEASLRPRRGGSGGPVHPAGLLPPEPAEHVHRPADGGDARRGPGPRRRVAGTLAPRHASLTRQGRSAAGIPAALGYLAMSAAAMTTPTLTLRWYSPILPSRPPAELFSTSSPVMWRRVSEARVTACCAASLQLLSDTPTSSMTRTTAGVLA